LAYLEDYTGMQGQQNIKICVICTNSFSQFSKCECRHQNN